MTESAPDGVEQTRSILDGRGWWRRGGRSRHTNERGKVDEVGRHLGDGAEGCAEVGAAGCTVDHDARVLRRTVEYAAGDGAAFVGEQFVRDALLHVVCLAGEHEQRLVLGFPAETCDGAVVPTGVEAAANLECGSCRLSRREVSEQNCIGCGFHESQPEYGRGDAEDDVVIGYGRCEVGLAEIAARRIGTSGNGVEAVDTAIERTVGVLDETSFANGAARCDERWNGVGCIVERSKQNLRILNRVLRAGEAGTAASG